MSYTWISQAVSLQLKENRKKSQRINLGHDCLGNQRETVLKNTK